MCCRCKARERANGQQAQLNNCFKVSPTRLFKFPGSILGAALDRHPKSVRIHYSEHPIFQLIESSSSVTQHPLQSRPFQATGNKVPRNPHQAGAHPRASQCRLDRYLLPDRVPHYLTLPPPKSTLCAAVPCQPFLTSLYSTSFLSLPLPPS